MATNIEVKRAARRSRAAMYWLYELHRTWGEGGAEQAATLYSTKTTLTADTQFCSHCDGFGGFREYLHIENGQCFYCNGTGLEEAEITLKWADGRQTTFVGMER